MRSTILSALVALFLLAGPAQAGYLWNNEPPVGDSQPAEPDAYLWGPGFWSELVSWFTVRRD